MFLTRVSPSRFSQAHHASSSLCRSLKKAAFLALALSTAQGVATCRTGHGWSAPVFVQLKGGSFGFQARRTGD